ncbi:MAG: sigma-70 family RNA polymerase sigma factor [Hyphomonadaceae bacterium]|nr:sigma-70 family RNA polymerase sigma factor [Hyphomonadaceae bacterium]
MAGQQTERVYDELLVTLARSGDHKAANRLAARWYPRLMRTALRLLQDRCEAEEAVQEAWAGICRGWPRLSDPAMFPGWAFGILRRKCVDRIRKVQTDRARSAPLETAPEPSQPARGELQVEIDQALAGLSDDHRLAAILYFGEGLSLNEIAAVTGVPVGTAKSRIFNARQHLKSRLKGET